MASNLKDIYVGVNQNDPNRNANDLYRTPPLATYLLCKYSNLPKNIVEPCAGYGNIAAELIRNGHNVTCYDLNEYPQTLVPVTTGVNALDLSKISGYDGLITNPPYKSDFPRKLVEKSIQDYSYTAMLLRITFLEGVKRRKLFEQHPPTQIIIFSDRVRFDSNELEPIEKSEQIGGMICYMWIIWSKTTPNSAGTQVKWVCMDEEYNEWRSHYESGNNRR
jgi:hypothetical protein